MLKTYCKLKSNGVQISWVNCPLHRFAATQAATQAKSVERNTEEWDKAKPYAAIPGPNFISLMRGHMPGGKYHNKKLHEVHGLFREGYGQIVKFKGSLGRRDIVMIFDPKDFETLFRKETFWPTRRGLEAFVYYRKHIRSDVFKGVGGLATEQGESWHDFRTVVNPVMMQPKTVKLYIPTVDSISKVFIQRLKTIRDDKNETPANFSEEVNRWSLESISCIALNTRLGVLNNDAMDEKARTFITAVRDFFDLSYQLDVLPSVWRYYHTSVFKKFVTTSDKLTEIIINYVETAMERLEKNPTPPGSEKGVLEKLMYLNRHTAKIMSFDMLMAGVDTTGSAFVGVLYCLAKNPEKQLKLREEILTILPSKDSPLTPENMRNLPYLRAVIKEGLRIHAPTVGTVRAAGQDMVLQGYQIPEDTDVLVSNLLLSNDANFFPKSDKFIPERFLKNETTTECPHAKQTHPFVYLPFGFGARSCIGRRFAELELEVLIVRMVREFNIEWHYEDIKFQSLLVNVPVGEIKFRLTDIN